jgi:hypothetical protein
MVVSTAYPGAAGHRIFFVVLAVGSVLGASLTLAIRRVGARAAAPRSGADR